MAWNESRLDDGPKPLWYQIAERLRVSIGRGEFVAGDRLPSETELHAAFGVSRTTARAALDSLKQEGLITRRSGKGSILLRRIEQPSQRLAGFAEDMRMQGLKPGYVTRAIRLLPGPVDRLRAHGLKPSEARDLLEIERLLLANDQPVGLSQSWLVPNILKLPRIPEIGELDGGSLYTWIEAQTGVSIVRGEEYVEATTADAAIARILDVPEGAPLLSVKRTSRAADGMVVEYAELRYRADRYRLRVELSR
jgi:GntR family transcriptional regulator